METQIIDPDSEPASGNGKRWYRRDPAVLAYLVVLLLGLYVSVAVVPAHITYDGYLYLQNSVVLYSDAMGDYYFWLREPGYPIALRALRDALGSSDLWVSLMQGAALVAAVALSLGAVWRYSARWAMVLAASLAFLNPLYMTYAGRVLQQPLLIFLVALLGFLAGLAWQDGARWPIIVGTPLVVITAALVAIQIGVAAVLSSVVIGLGLSRPRPAGENSSLNRLAVGGGVFLISLIAFIGVTSYWQGVKNSEITPVSFGNSSATDTVSSSDEDVKSTIVSMVETIPELLSLTDSGDFLGQPGAYENRIYAAVSLHPNWRCGAAEEIPATSELLPEVRAGILSANCRSAKAGQLYSNLLVPGQFIMVASSASLLVGLVVATTRRHWAVAAASVPAAIVLAEYAYIGYGLDRYGTVAFPIGMAFFGYLVSQVLLALTLVARKSRSPNDGVAS